MGRDDDDDDVIERRRRKREADSRTWLLLVLAVAAGGLLAAGGGVAALVLLGGRNAPGEFRPVGEAITSATGPREDKEGVEWSHKDLLGHLNKNGMTLAMTASGVGEANGPAAVFAPDGTEFWDNPRHMDLTKLVYVQKRKTPQEARDAAGVESDAFSWGCFYFRTKNATLAGGIKRALGVG